jgi:hypothetical protein
MAARASHAIMQGDAVCDRRSSGAGGCDCDHWVGMRSFKNGSLLGGWDCGSDTVLVILSDKVVQEHAVLAGNAARLRIPQCFVCMGCLAFFSTTYL